MNSFESNIQTIYGLSGKKWLKELPKIINDLALKLKLRDLQAVPNMSYNYVASGFQKDRPIVLKLGLDAASLKQEARSLKHFIHHGAVQILDEGDHFILLERALPGVSLKSYLPERDLEAVKIACQTMQCLHQAPVPHSHNFPHIREWFSILDKDWNLPAFYLEKARNLRDRLLTTNTDNVLLHGDLHHDNMLQNGDQWLVIDPKGVMGHPINEVWAFVVNIESDTQFIANFFGFDLQQVRDWYFVHLILAACWNLEDHLDCNLFLNLAKKAYILVT